MRVAVPLPVFELLQELRAQLLEGRIPDQEFEDKWLTTLSAYAELPAPGEHLEIYCATQERSFIKGALS